MQQSDQFSRYWAIPSSLLIIFSSCHTLTFFLRSQKCIAFDGPQKSRFGCFNMIVMGFRYSRLWYWAQGKLDVYKRQVLRRIHKNTARSIDYKQPKFKIGDRVRISKYKITFAKGYMPNWTNEIFHVHTVRTASVPVTYSLKDHTGEVLKLSLIHI